MKYRDVNWSLIINDKQASADDNCLDFIAEEIQKGNTSGMFTTYCTDYNKVEKLKNKLENELGRDVDFCVEDDDKGELEDLLAIAKENKDNYTQELIEEILEIGFEN